MAKITRSPRAPSFDLEESLKRALELYEVNGKHPTPVDVAAKQLGYSGANNGSAARALASMKAFGLLVSNNKGDVAAPAELEDYKHAPEEQVRNELLVRWLRSPKIYDELLVEYHDRLPSDQVIRYKLIKKGFSPTSAEECLKTFISSVAFVDYFGVKRSESMEPDRPAESPSPLWGEPDVPQASQMSSHTSPSLQYTQPRSAPPPPTSHPVAADATLYPTDRYPVRLSKGRRAWIEVPSPFYAVDKDMLKNQIDLIFTDDEESDYLA